jgi:hypothetical protein
LTRRPEARPMRLRRVSRHASLVRLPCPEPASGADCTPRGAGVSHAYADRVSDQSHQSVPPCIGAARSRRVSTAIRPAQGIVTRSVAADALCNVACSADVRPGDASAPIGRA